MMGGGRGIPILMFTSAIVGLGTTISSARSIVPRSIFFIFMPPLSVSKYLCTFYIISHKKGKSPLAYQHRKESGVLPESSSLITQTHGAEKSLHPVLSAKGPQ